MLEKLNENNSLRSDILSFDYGYGIRLVSDYEYSFLTKAS